MRLHLLTGAVPSGNGETTLILGLFRILRNRSLRVQPFKYGPDYIDTRHHKVAAGYASVSLDGFTTSEGHVKDPYARYTPDVGVAVTEGATGLFDDHDAMRGGNAEISGLLQIPIVLVVNAKGIACSVAPLFCSFRNLWKDLNVAGAVLNFVVLGSHYSLLRQACENTGVGALGHLPKCADIEIPSRHLELSLDEDFCFEEFADRVVYLVEEHVDIDRLLTITALPGRQPAPRAREAMRTVSKANLGIVIVRDPASNFLHEENTHLLSVLSKVTYFSPLRDGCLPEADSVYLPGGYSELYLSELSMNSGMRGLIHFFMEVGGKLLTEYGEMMCLRREIIGTGGSAYPMAGVLPQPATMGNMKLRLGYWILCYKDDVLRGHKFHYSRIVSMENPLPSVAKALTTGGGQTDTPLHHYKNVLAKYTHLYRGDPCRSGRFIDYLHGEAPDCSR